MSLEPLLASLVALVIHFFSIFKRAAGSQYSNWLLVVAVAVCRGIASLWLVVKGDYLATFSRRFIMANMKMAAARQTAMNTVHTTHRGRSPHR